VTEARHEGAQRRAQGRRKQGRGDNTELIAKEPEKGASPLYKRSGNEPEDSDL
jgi:hypothetical protein